MKSTKFILLIFTIFAIHFFSENKVHAQIDISDQFTWGQMIHGGGFVTGMHIHPSGDPIFCRADVAGAYRWNSQKNEWKNVVTAASLPNEVPYDYKGVISIVSAPGDANRAYMAYNENLYYSNNKGDAWSVASSQGVPQLKMGTNDRTGRFDGERLSVDPKNNDVVYYGSNQDGLLRSIDGGKNWSVVYSGGKVQTSGGEYPGIVPVVDGASSLTSGRSSIVYFTSYGEGIYKSTNGGDSFSKIHDTRAEDLEINDQGVLFACSENFLVKYENNSFSNISPGNRRWTDIAVNGSELWVIDRGGSNFYYSADKGANWTKQATNYTSQDVPWLPTEDGLWRSVGELEYNPATGALWMSEGVGVWMCANPVASTVEWYSRTKEIGELVVFDVAVLDNGQVASVQADKALIVTDNTGPATDYFPHSFVAGWDLAVCHNQRNFVAANIAPQPWNPQGVPQLVYSTDNGNTFTQMANLPPASKRVGGKIEVASDNTSNIVWVPCDGSREIYYTTNLGNSWTKATVEGTDGIMWNEHSYNKVLAADPNLPGTFYYITTGADFMRSTDNGATWAKTTTNSPPVGFHCVYKMVPGHEGHILYTPGIVDINSADLFFSENRGATFTNVPNVSEVATVAVGKAAPGASYPTVFIVGKVNGIQGVYLSTDKMETWQWMTDYPRGIHSPIRAMEGDPNSFGDLYGGFHAAGVWYAKYTGTPCTNLKTLSVLNGSGSGEICVGSEVAVCAAIPECKEFASWTGNTVYLDDPSLACATVTMPDANISLTATFIDKPFYAINVYNGTASSSQACEGTEINVTANAAPAGHIFESWIGDTAYLADPGSHSTILTMPANNVNLDATYKEFTRQYISQSLPGKIECEYYDYGGQGIAYNDDNTKEGDLTFRPEDNVDVSAKTAASNGYSIGYSNPGEWVEFTLDTVITGNYDIVFTYASGATEQGDLKISLNGIDIATITEITSTGSWETFTTTTLTDVAINSVSNPILRLEYVGAVANFDLDAIEFILSDTTSYSLTVLNGNGGGSYEEGTVVNISANAAPSGEVFDQWTGDIANVADAFSSNTTLTMPASDISVTATFKVVEGLGISNLSPSDYAVATLTAGIEYYTDRTFKITSVPSYLEGNDFIKTANNDKNGGTVSFSVNQMVDIYIAYDSRSSAPSWMSDFTAVPETIGNNDSGFNLYKKSFPAGTVSLGGNEANSMYIVIIDVPNNQPTTYSLTVNSGSGDGSYEEGTVVNISANAAPTGQEFDQWTGDVASVTDVNALSTSITMPAANTSITATYKDVVVQTYSLIVQSGSGDGSYEEGTVVNISANAAPAGQIFDQWTGDVASVTDVNASSTSITMPASGISVTATYKVEEGLYISNLSPLDYVVATLTVGIEYYTDRTFMTTSVPSYLEGNDFIKTANSDKNGGTVSFSVNQMVDIYIAYDSRSNAPSWMSDFTAVPETIGNNDSGFNLYKKSFPAGTVSLGGNEASSMYIVIIDVPNNQPTTYSLNVNSGTGDGSYEEGTVVNISANAAPTGQEFDQWTGDVANVTDVNASSTSITMPAANVSITATYKDVVIQTYSLTVQNGSGDGSYAAGTVVNISANAAPAGQEFDQWTGDVANVTDVNVSSTSITMPAVNASITATYKDVVIQTYSLTVQNGSGDGSYAAGTVVNISANAAPAGQIFDQWTGDVANVTDVNVSSTSITMPAVNASITATYRDVQQISGLMHQWKFNNNGNDEIGTADATLYSGAGYITGYENQALDLDGSNSNQYAGVGVVDLGNAFTISTWAYNPGTQVHQNWLIANYDGTYGFRLYVNSYNTTDGKICFETKSTNGTDNTTSAAGAFPFNQWNHVAVTIESTGAYIIYVNGAQVHSGTVMSGTPFNQDLDMGTQGYNTWNSWKGQIDNVKIFDQTLSASEITDDMNNGLKSGTLISDVTPESLLLKVSLYPNPVSHGLVTILNVDPSMEQLIIYDMTGKVVSQKHLFNESQVTFNVEGYVNGLYIVNLKNDHKNEYLKLLVK